MRSFGMSALFGEAVKGARLELAMTQEELAARISVTRAYVGHIERGRKRVSLEMAQAVAYGLNSRLSALITRAEEIAADAR